MAINKDTIIRQREKETGTIRNESNLRRDVLLVLLVMLGSCHSYRGDIKSIVRCMFR